MALGALSNAWAVCAAGGITDDYPLLGPDLVRLALAADQRDRAAAVAEQVQDAAARIGAPWAEGAALRCRGLVDDDPEFRLQACSALRTSPRILDQALTLEDTGRALAGAGRTQQAQATIEQAAGLYDGLHAARGLARAESQLRALGLRRGQRGQRRHPAHGWDSLTRTELAVVDLVAEGLTNREAAQRLFISPRTVETHLAHVFAKLGISSRVELKKQAAHRDRPGLPRATPTDAPEGPASP